MKFPIKKIEIEHATGSVIFKPTSSVDHAPEPGEAPADAAGTLRRQLAGRVENDLRKFNVNEVCKVIRKSIGKRLQIIPSDREYYVCSETLVREIIEESGIDKLKYKKERRDCEDFALYLKNDFSRHYLLNSCAIVFAWSGGHAFSAVLVHSNGRLEIRFIEPQTDGDILKSEGQNNMSNGMIWI